MHKLFFRRETSTDCTSLNSERRHALRETSHALTPQLLDDSVPEIDHAGWVLMRRDQSQLIYIANHVLLDPTRQLKCKDLR
jgi:hypothetical protein